MFLDDDDDDDDVQLNELLSPQPPVDSLSESICLCFAELLAVGADKTIQSDDGNNKM